MNTKKAEIITHLAYTELFDSFERNGIFLPSSSLKTIENIEVQIEYLLQKINPVELIQFSSFLNMICQSYGAERSMIRGISLLEETKLIKPGTGFSNRIVFHRENLLNLIGRILSKETKGAEQLTGTGTITNPRKYAQAILLNNDLLNVETSDSTLSKKEMILKDYFIREWPHYYITDTSKTVYGHRIVRYRYCYETILPKLKAFHKQMVQKAINTFEQEVGVSLREYMHVLSSLFGWFLEWPLNREKNPSVSSDQKLGFDFKNINSFYISSRAFMKDPSFMKTISTLSKDVTALRIAIEKEQNRERDIISGYNKHVRVFFDNPVFRISDEYYCIIDLKFVLENACGGLLWRIRTQENIQDFKSAYGYLMEEYFRFLIKNIFKNAKITFGGDSGADAIVEQGNIIIVIEFTTEYYRLSSLYNSFPEEFLDDAYRILFNTGTSDPRGRNKSDKGKLFKLNDYVGKAKRDGKTVIPVLITENLFGNPDLFNDFSNFYDTEISCKKLSKLQKHQPVFLCLDDLETFWGLHEPKDAIKGFTEFAQKWTTIDKGPHFHNASAVICKLVEKERGEARISNKDFAEFFSSKKIYGKTRMPNSK